GGPDQRGRRQPAAKPYPRAGDPGAQVDAEHGAIGQQRRRRQGAGAAAIAADSAAGERAPQRHAGPRPGGASRLAPHHLASPVGEARRIGGAGERGGEGQLHPLLPDPAVTAATCSSRSWRFSTLPTLFNGSALTMSMLCGHLYDARRSRQWAISSASVAPAPGTSTTSAWTTSPRRSSGSPMTAAWPTAGWATRTSSTSRGMMLKPPRMI